MTADEHMMELVAKIDDLVDEHFESRGDNTAFDAIGALGYFAGVLLAHAPDNASRQEAYNLFSQMFSDGLNCEQHTKH